MIVAIGIAVAALIVDAWLLFAFLSHLKRCRGSEGGTEKYYARREPQRLTGGYRGGAVDSWPPPPAGTPAPVAPAAMVTGPPVDPHTPGYTGPTPVYMPCYGCGDTLKCTMHLGTSEAPNDIQAPCNACRRPEWMKFMQEYYDSH